MSCVYTRIELCIHKSFLVYTQQHHKCMLPTLHLYAQAALTKWLKMLFAYGWGDPYSSGSRIVYCRKLPNGMTQEVDVADVTSHIVKHGAPSNAGSSSCPQ